MKVTSGSGGLPISIVDSQLDVTFTRPADTNAYTAGDALSNSTTAPTALTFTGIGNSLGCTLMITDIIVTSTTKGATLPNLNLWLFNSLPTATNDNAAFAVTDAHNLLVEAVIPLTLTYSAVNNSRVEAHNISAVVDLKSDSTNLYALLEVTNAFTPGSADVFVIRIKGKVL
jgi:hypothetical protein